jgi:hypothetical protein
MIMSEIMELFSLKQSPDEDTEWNDVLRQKGILPPKPKEAEVTEEQIENLVDSVVKEYTSNGNVCTQYSYYVYIT